MSILSQSRSKKGDKSNVYIIWVVFVKKEIRHKGKVVRTKSFLDINKLWVYL